MRGTLTFTNPDDVVPDEERPGLLRARVVQDDEVGDVRAFDLRDLRDTDEEPGLEAAGFETIDLADNDALQAALATISANDEITDADAGAIRDSLAEQRFELVNGATLKIELVVDDGLFHRRSGPNGLDVNPDGIVGINGHGGAAYVHGDQDVYGTPLRQLMHGAAPDTFRHITPDGRNDDADTFLLNLWIPLHAPVQPLALMDRRTLDASKHQLRYGLPVDGFLEREEDAGVNDIWSFLYDADQEWYIRTDMGPEHGFVFDTLGTPHGAAVLPGEDLLGSLSLALDQTCSALENGGPVDESPDAEPPSDAPPSIRAAAQKMGALLARAGDLQPHEVSGWVVEARLAVGAVIRRSIEMRLIATLTAE